jgi:hypothetical protein
VSRCSNASEKKVDLLCRLFAKHYYSSTTALRDSAIS